MIVLLGGLALIVWLFIATTIGYFLAFPLKAPIPRAIVGLVLAVGLPVLALHDEIRGRAQFEELCASGGVYKISPSAQGSKFDLVFSATEFAPLAGFARPTEEKTISYSVAATGEVVATAKVYHTSGGWLVQKRLLALTSTDGPLLGRGDCRPSAAEEARRQAITNKVLN